MLEESFYVVSNGHFKEIAKKCEAGFRVFFMVFHSYSVFDSLFQINYKVI